MQFELTVLGVSAAAPAFGRHPSAQVLNISDQLYLIDCGEGTQAQMLKYHIRRSRIDHIFISHLHGDHMYGLIGLLTSYSLNSRAHPMHIYSPEGLQEIIELLLQRTAGPLPFDLIFHPIDTTRHYLLHEDDKVEVYSIPLLHRLPTSGFLFREKERPRNMRPEAINEWQIPFTKIPDIKKGADYTLPDGRRIPNESLTLPPYKARSFAYCSDTCYTESIVPFIKGIDLLYHETTFTKDRQEEAIQSMHSTAEEAAWIADAAQVGQLVIGHYSSRYKDPEVLVQEAAAIFPNTVAGEEGKVYAVELGR